MFVRQFRKKKCFKNTFLNMKTEIGAIMCYFLNMKSADQTKAIHEIKIKSTKQKTIMLCILEEPIKCNL